ncbi:MAG: RNB domain-containing ribonuclease [Acidobacteria bacterium]|nr:RNB domain-containing ribonuclease [Acidobacteriota bacterium]
MADYEGKVIEFLDGAGLRLALVIRHTGNKLQVLDERGKHDRVSPHHVVLVHSDKIALSEFLTQASQLKSRIESIKEQIDAELLWESVQDEPREFSLAELAQNYFGDHDAVHRSALFRALMEDTLHFRRKGSLFIARLRQQVADQLMTIRRRQEKEAFRQQALQWIQQVLTADGDAAVPPEMVGLLQQTEDFLLRKKSNEAAYLLGQASEDLPAKEAAFELLVKTGRLDPDADPLLVVAGIEERFPRRVLEQAERLVPFQGEAGRRDFTALAAFSIDDEETREVDDALTVEVREECLRVGIHIADVAYFVAKADPMDEEAYRRSVSIYLPTRTVTMFPERLAYTLASLHQDQLRPTMSFQIDFDETGQVLDWRLHRGQVRVARRLSYVEADQMLESSAIDEVIEHLRRLRTISSHLTDQRLAHGAIIIRRPELKIRVRDGQINLKVIDPHSPSRRLISELMILANRLAAQHATRQGLPVIFRTQDPPLVDPGVYGGGPDYDPIGVSKILKGMKRSRPSLFPQPHAGLGLDAYTQLTSPIRRFSDIVIQRQMAAHLAGQPVPYEREELLEILTTAEAAERDMQAIERQATRFWALQYLTRLGTDHQFEAMIVEGLRGGYVVELSGLAIQGYLPTKNNHELGDYLRVTIEHVDPKRNVLRLREAK